MPWRRPVKPQVPTELRSLAEHGGVSGGFLGPKIKPKGFEVQMVQQVGHLVVGEATTGFSEESEATERTCKN